MRSWVGVAGCIAFAVSACATSSVFNCDKDSDCAAGEGFGVCQATGYCSFSDPSCESGQRYGSLAGQGLAKECVPPEIASGTGSETAGETSDGTSEGGSTSSATTLPLQTSTTTDPGSSSGPLPTSSSDTSGSGSSTTGITDCSGFIDDFEDGVIADAWDNPNPQLIAETDGQLQITITAPGGDFHPTIYTMASYDLTQGDARVRLGTMPTVDETHQSLRVFPQASPGDELFFRVQGDQLQALHDPPTGTVPIYHEDDFDPVDHAWLRIRGAGDIVNFEFSDDGESWQTFSSVNSPIPLDDLSAGVMGGNWTSSLREAIVSFEVLAVCPQ